MTIAAPAAERLLPRTRVTETYEQHLAVFGNVPSDAARSVMAELEHAHLGGRGGAGFPAAVKWRAVAERSVRRGPAVVVADAVETEPASAKDRTLLALRPHLVFDGMQLAAAAVTATRAILYVSRSHDALVRMLHGALQARRASGAPELVNVEIVTAPPRYVAGEETAVVARLNGRQAKPHAVPPRPFDAGVGGRPTLVTNVETLAQAALIARHGAAWFRGPDGLAATTLVTVSGAVANPGVFEPTFAKTVGDVIAMAGGATAEPIAVLVGGYFGRWVDAAHVWPLSIEPQTLAAAGLSLGAGVIAVLPRQRCGVAETDRVLTYLAGESAGQCGPCHQGLPALAALFHEVALGRGHQQALDRLARWSLEIRGRGACRHPDGATFFAASALKVFASELRRHLRSGPCPAAAAPPLLPIPDRVESWR